MYSKYKSLEELWGFVDGFNHEHFPETTLKPIFGNGKIFRPKFMFVFINPTRANSSSNKEWPGPRFPFIGTKAIWRIFHRAGMFDDVLLDEINNTKQWSLELTNKVLNFLESHSFYFTNIVKWTGHDAALPDSEKIKLFLPVLEREIELVQPTYIITLGLIPFENLTGQKIKLKDYYCELMKTKKITSFHKDYDGCKTKIIPCYFPVGRGDPKKAVEILKLVNTL